MHNKRRGFTIVELLVVIVVIAILATITVVAYNSIQQRARDSQRRQDVQTIVKALEMYYTDKGFYPNSTMYNPGSTTMNAAWTTTADASWANLETILSPYVKKLPRDPISTPGIDVRFSVGYDYQLFVNQSTYCGVQPGQAYILNYRLESTTQSDTLNGDCTTNPLGPYGSIDYRIVK